ncbi:type II toxin-antitoxin system prevent-host-death family antitoxin [Mycobacterium sp. NPDC050441]|uniref:type II toxin-antitoxin system Phd/YefM family antitoxin n=1 Tax=Mycobacterium sp. NPDC050441 TaxID=3155403 RepID=UPI0033F0E1BB
MGDVSIRMLSQETEKVLARVRQGEEITLSDCGVVVARLVPAKPRPLDRLIGAGRVTPARTRGPAPRPTVSMRIGDEEAAMSIARLRAEERA